MIITPKPNLNKLKLREKAIGTERRLNMSKEILENGTPFPKTVTYEDIDLAFEKWVINDLNIEYNGKKLPTFKLFSNQRINEYAQSWKHLDDNGNLLMNFKTITRESNPQQGSSQGGYFNIPGHRDYPMFNIPVLQENGQLAIDQYTMKQPFSVDFKYTITLVTNQYKLLNKMNELIHYHFQALQCYIFPNDHPMPLTLDSISDESEYSIEDRKYYSQSFTILLKGYIIRQEDFQVHHLPTRRTFRFDGDKNTRKNVKIEIEDDETFQTVKINIHLIGCNKQTKFVIDCDFVLDTIEVSNTYDIVICVNEEKIDLQKDEIRFYNGDEITILTEKDIVNEDNYITLIGYDPSVKLNSDNTNKESTLDEEKNIKEKNFEF